MPSTLAQLRTRVREKVDEDTAAFWSDTVINSQLNEAYRYYWAFILKLYEDAELRKRFGEKGKELINKKANYDQNLGQQFYAILGNNNIITKNNSL